MALYHFSVKVLSRGGRNTVRALAYRAGCELYDERTGETFNYKDKPVQHVELVLPKDAPEWAVEIQKLMVKDRQKGVQAFSDRVEAAEKRIDAQVYREFEFALHRELTNEQNIALAREFVTDQICQHGMAAQLNFHFDVDEKTGETKPHCHVMVTTRRLEENGLSAKKERDWNKREFLCDLRIKWEEYSNFHLKLHGHEIQIDHRSHKERGIEMEPQPKMGRGVLEQEKRLQRLEGGEKLSPITDKAKAFHDVQLRNLYRIIRNPEVVFDIVTKHHATFMWGDVQKVLHRYVDDGELFQRLDGRLKNSKELLLLRMNGDQEGRIEERSIYTTHSMLKAEKELVGTAEGLAACKTHAVSSSSLEQGLSGIQEKLKDARLSEGQERAIQHLVEPGQLKCIVGYAGAGKTTALDVCREIWEAEGYQVYGLAPTGRAAQNLEGSGIPSQTLHKFLKSFDEGRCQYSDKSILVLDEAGMVDVERFEGFLGAVKTLGVKAVVVGDAAQLQPVEAGPAFRLVTERVGVSRLEEVLRQKEEWQREATVLFGKQESAKAIQTYQEKGHIHLIEEKLPEGNMVEDVVKRYEISARTSGLIFREIIKDTGDSETGNLYEKAKSHEDYKEFMRWRSIQKEAGKEILSKPDVYRSALEERRLDPLEMAKLFVNKEQNKESQYKEAHELLKIKKLDHLIGIERAPGQTVEVRSAAKAALIEDWKKAYQEDPHKSLLMMAYSNRDVRDLNERARDHLKASGDIGKEQFTYRITREVEDDFGRKTNIKEERPFSKGDRIVFTRNDGGLGVKNGSIGTIQSLDQNKIEVKLDEGKTFNFSPNLFAFFDQGWAVTIHKSQGTTVGKSFLLASHEMNQNLTYVAMTRHQEDVQVYGSRCDFWREGKVADVLSKSGEKLSAADYLDAPSLTQLMKEEDHFLTKLFTRLSDELHAMGAVSKQAFKNVADHFLGRTSERDIHLKPEVVREEARAQDILQKKDLGSEALQGIYEDMSHPAFKAAEFIKKVFHEGVKRYGEEAAIGYWQEKREPYMKLYEQKLETVDQELQSPLLSYLSDKSRELA
ncbi:MAG TPA: AAA family ATPase, partial [Alphaproteobacteria bacterium]|nr:AAA family ATPase [Alphaproteobacteria bacterium]